MSDAPERIYLNLGNEETTYAEAVAAGWEVSWCEGEQDEWDVEYVHADLYEQQAQRIAELERHATFNIQSKIDNLTLNNIYVVVESMPGGLSTVLVLSPNQTVNSKDEVDYFSDVASALDWAAWRAAKPKPAQPPQEQSE